LNTAAPTSAPTKKTSTQAPTTSPTIKSITETRAKGKTSSSSRTTGAFAAVALLILIPGGIYYARSRHLKKKDDAGESKGKRMFGVYSLEGTPSGHGEEHRNVEDGGRFIGKSAIEKEQATDEPTNSFRDETYIQYGISRIDIAIGDAGDVDDLAAESSFDEDSDDDDSDEGHINGGDFEDVDIHDRDQDQYQYHGQDNDDVASAVSDVAFHRVFPAKPRNGPASGAAGGSTYND
jgi:hypothetical protein